MLDGVDVHKDAIGIVRQEEFICGDCLMRMKEIGNSRFTCPKCGAVISLS
jgi:tRNA(Ile2) C34 agmatinyltransferase TiaS